MTRKKYRRSPSFLRSLLFGTLTVALSAGLASGCASAESTKGTKNASVEQQPLIEEEDDDGRAYRLRYLLQANEALAARFDQLAEQMQVHFAEQWPGSKPQVEREPGALSVQVSFDQPPSYRQFADFVQTHYPMVTVPPDLDATVTLALDEERASSSRTSVVTQTMAVLAQRLESTGLDRDQFEVLARENYTIDVIVPREGPPGVAIDQLDQWLRRKEEFALRRVDDANAYAFFKYLDLPEGAAFDTDQPGGASVTHPDKDVLVEFFADKAPDDHRIGYELSVDRDDTGATSTYWRAHYLWDESGLGSEHLNSVDTAVATGMNRPYVAINLTPGGARRFEKFTAANVGKRIAIMVGDRVYSAPVINEPIPGGRIQLSLGMLSSFTELLSEANHLTHVIRHSMLGPQLKKLSEGPIGDS